jgi:hypothetical protein
MSFNRNHARALLTGAELELFNLSLGDAAEELPPRTLVAKIGRTRRLRDKYRDLLRRQKLAIRERTGSKRGASGVANVRTQQKAELFQEALARFERRLERVQAEARRQERLALLAAKQAATTKRKGPKSAAKRPAVKRGTGYMSAAAKGAERRLKLHKSRTTAIHAHLRASGKRAQARRDRRG